MKKACTTSPHTGLDTTPGESQNPRIETIIFYSSHPVRLANFYRTCLGCDDSPQRKDLHGFPVGSLYLIFHEDHQITGPPHSRTSIWFTVDDLQSCYQVMINRGGRVRYPPTLQSFGKLTASVYDPDNNIIGLIQRQL